MNMIFFSFIKCSIPYVFFWPLLLFFIQHSLAYLDKNTYVFTLVDLDIFLELPTVFTECTQSLNYFSTLKKKSAGGQGAGRGKWERRIKLGRKRNKRQEEDWGKLHVLGKNSVWGCVMNDQLGQYLWSWLTVMHVMLQSVGRFPGSCLVNNVI